MPVLLPSQMPPFVQRLCCCAVSPCDAFLMCFCSRCRFPDVSPFPVSGSPMRLRREAIPDSAVKPDPGAVKSKTGAAKIFSDV